MRSPRSRRVKRRPRPSRSRRVLASFESRDDYLEGVPVADTVLVLRALATRRGLTVELEGLAAAPRRVRRRYT